MLDKRETRIKTFMLIEAKRPDDFDSYTRLIEDQLFATGRDEHSRGICYIVWYTIDFRDEEILGKGIITDFRNGHVLRVGDFLDKAMNLQSWKMHATPSKPGAKRLMS